MFLDYFFHRNLKKFNLFFDFFKQRMEHVFLEISVVPFVLETGNFLTRNFWLWSNEWYTDEDNLDGLSFSRTQTDTASNERLFLFKCKTFV